MRRPEPWATIAPLIKDGHREDALKQLNRYLEHDRRARKEPERSRVRFTLGVLAYRAGRYAPALEILNRVQVWGEMAPYLAYYRGASLFQLERYAECLAPLGEVQGSALDGYALESRLEALAGLGQWEALGEILSAQRSRGESPIGAATLAYYDVRLAAARGKTKGLHARLREVVAAHPTSEIASRALKDLAGVGFPAGFADDLAAYQAAARALDAGAEKRALSALKGLLERWGDDHPLRCAASSDLVRAAFDARDYEAARAILTGRYPQCVKDPRFADFLFVGARCLWRLGDREGARALYARLRELFPEHSYRDDALLYQAMTRREDEDEAGYLADLEEAIGRYPKDDRHGEIRWWHAWAQVKPALAPSSSAEQRARALRWLREGYDATHEAVFLYWEGRLLGSHKASRGDARGVYERLLEAHPLDYYATLGFARLAKLRGGGAALAWLKNTADANAQKAPALIPRAALAAELAKPSQRRFRELYTLGFVDLASEEYPGRAGTAPEDASKKDQVSTAALWLKAVLLASDGRHDLSHQIVRRGLRDYREHYPQRSFRRFWTLGYPRPWKKTATAASNKVGLVVEFIESIVREESGFVPDIVSYANAHGLMQLLPSTARLVASKNGLPRPSVDGLHEAGRNLLLGSLYLDYLVRRFGSPMLAAGGYNAGHGRMDKWLNEQPDVFDLDVFVEDIPYRQARHYVKRVIETYGVYRYLNSEGKRMLTLSLRYDRSKRHDKAAALQKWAPKPKKKAKRQKKRSTKSSTTKKKRTLKR